MGGYFNHRNWNFINYWVNHIRILLFVGWWWLVNGESMGWFWTNGWRGWPGGQCSNFPAGDWVGKHFHVVDASWSVFLPGFCHSSLVLCSASSSKCIAHIPWWAFIRLVIYLDISSIPQDWSDWRNGGERLWCGHRGRGARTTPGGGLCAWNPARGMVGTGNGSDSPMVWLKQIETSWNTTRRYLVNRVIETLPRMEIYLVYRCL